MLREARRPRRAGHRGRRSRAGPAGCPPSQKRHGRVIAMQSLGSENMGADQIMDRLQGSGASPDLIGQRGEAEIDAFPGITLGLAVQGLMLAELLEEDRGQQVRACPSTRRGMERRWRLRDPLAIPAGELLADRLDHFPLPRDHLQRLGDILAHLHDPGRTAAAAGRWGLDDQALARQMLRKRLACRTTAFESGNIRDLRRGAFRRNLVLGGGGLEFLELQFHLVDQPGAAFRVLAILLPPQFGDLQLEVPDHRLGGGDDCPHLCELGLGRGGTRLRCRKRGAQPGNLRSSIIHGRKLPCHLPKAQQKQLNIED